MQITQTMLDVCEEALYLIRQDVTLPTPAEAETATDMEWVKCRKAFDLAAAEVLAAHDWAFARAEGYDGSTVDGWPAHVRKALVYCLASEIAVQVAGRTEDLKNWHALYERHLLAARLKDLSDERSDDRFVREVMAVSSGVVPPDRENLPRSMKAVYDRIADLKPLAMRDVLAAHAWSFATENERTGSTPLDEEGLGEYVNWAPLPEGCVRLVGVYGPDGELLEWERVAGQVRAIGRISRLSYVRDVEDLDEFSPDARRLVILKVAADLMKSVGAGTDARRLQEQLYRDALAEAKVRDSRQSNPSPRAVWGSNHYADVMHGDADPFGG